MFARLSTALLALALASTVIAGGQPTKTEYEQCNGGTVQCCNSTQDSKNLSQDVQGLIAGLGIKVSQLTGQVGLGCSGVKVLAIGGGSSCTQQKVCCSNNNFNGFVAIGCTPINISV
ncbi:hydrophobin-251 [Coprinopsis sp. MPI-PUGE-AT-0042]|nr:hydrophobin-251 [Coprinopsis sp. MPI-PUGE-AT-0042]